MNSACDFEVSWARRCPLFTFMVTGMVSWEQKKTWIQPFQPVYLLKNLNSPSPMFESFLSWFFHRFSFSPSMFKVLNYIFTFLCIFRTTIHITAANVSHLIPSSSISHLWCQPETKNVPGPKIVMNSYSPLIWSTNTYDIKNWVATLSIWNLRVRTKHLRAQADDPSIP